MSILDIPHTLILYVVVQFRQINIKARVTSHIMDLEKNNLEEPALGRDGFLGDLYDARTGQFLGGSIFAGKFPQDAVTTLDRCHQDYSFDHENTYSSALNNWNIEGELKLNILSGLIKIEGKGKYVNSANINDRVQRITLVSKIQMKRDVLHIAHASLQSMICASAFTEPRATHVLTEIVWGANVSVTFDEKTNKSEKNKEVSGTGEASVGEQIAKVVDPSVSAEIKYLKQKETNGSTIKITFQGDAVFGSPSTIDEAMVMIKSIPDKIASLNSGKGVQVAYKFTPLERIVRYVSTVLSPTILSERIPFRQTDNDLIRRIENTFDLLLIHTQRLNAFIDDVQNLKDYFYDNDISVVLEHKVRHFLKASIYYLFFYSYNSIRTSADLQEISPCNCKTCVKTALQLKPSKLKAQLTRCSKNSHKTIEWKSTIFFKITSR